MLPFRPDAFASTFFSKQADAWADRYQSPTYQQRRPIVGKNIRKEVLRLNRPAMTIKLLDFGCGSGVIAKDAAALGLQVTGVDNSQAMIDAAREQLSGFGKQVNLEWLQSGSVEANMRKIAMTSSSAFRFSSLFRIFTRYCFGSAL